MNLIKALISIQSSLCYFTYFLVFILKQSLGRLFFLLLFFVSLNYGI